MVCVASISDRVGDLGEYLREQREHARLSVRQLATLAGVSNPYLSQVERGLRKPSAEVLQQIARGLRISAEALYVRAGILDEEGRADVEAAINTDPELNDRQRRVLLDIYASFRAENRRAATDAEPVPPRPATARATARRVRKAARPTTRAARPGRTTRGAAAARAGTSAGTTAGTAPVATPPAEADPSAPTPAENLSAAQDVAPGDATAPDTVVRASRTTSKRAAPRAPRRATGRSTRASRRGSAAGEGPASAEPADPTTPPAGDAGTGSEP
jgi:transcriptional regulator with XRE-family HTH domain